MRLGPLAVDDVDPAAVEAFWAAALGAPAQQALLSFRPQLRLKTVKNRVHLDVYVRDIAPLLDLGARMLAEHSAWVTLADIEGNEFCAVLDSALDGRPPARSFAVCTDSDRPEELAAWWAPTWAMAPTARRAGSTDLPAGRRSSGSSSAWTTSGWFPEWTLRADRS